MTQHRHAEMIKAKADNMDLVVFTDNGNGWVELPSDDYLPAFNPENEYFLCLPQHKEACLHWLNGEKIQNNVSIDKNDDAWIDFVNFGSDICEPWSVSCNFMREQSHFRIKPRKEKRVIGVNVSTSETTRAYAIDEDGNYARDEVVLTRKKEKLSDWQFIEIEVEV